MDIIGHPNYLIYEDGRVWHKRWQRFIKQSDRCQGYKSVKCNGRNYSVHRLIALHYIPNPDNKPYVDHIDRNNTNNAITNLRWATPQETMMNVDRRDDVNIRLHGISFQVVIKRHTQQHYVGRYATIEEARAARDAWMAENP